MSPRRQEEPISYLKVETESITQGDNLDTFTPTRDSGHHYLDTSAGQSTYDHKMMVSPLSLENTSNSQETVREATTGLQSQSRFSRHFNNVHKGLFRRQLYPKLASLT